MWDSPKTQTRLKFLHDLILYGIPFNAGLRQKVFRRKIKLRAVTSGLNIGPRLRRHHQGATTTVKAPPPWRKYGASIIAAILKAMTPSLLRRHHHISMPPKRQGRPMLIKHCPGFGAQQPAAAMTQVTRRPRRRRQGIRP